MSSSIWQDASRRKGPRMPSLNITGQGLPRCLQRVRPPSAIWVPRWAPPLPCSPTTRRWRLISVAQGAARWPTWPTPWPPTSEPMLRWKLRRRSFSTNVSPSTSTNSPRMSTVPSRPTRHVRSRRCLPRSCAKSCQRTSTFVSSVPAPIPPTRTLRVPLQSLRPCRRPAIR